MDNKTKQKTEELFFVLDKLVSLHRNLIELLREEYAHMTSLDIKGLSEAAYAKEVFLSEIWTHEQRRMELVDGIAHGFGIDPNSLTLLSLSQLLPDSGREHFRVVREALTLLMGQAKELNARNMIFAESSIERIETMKKNALGLNNNTAKENYSNSGSRQPASDQGGRLLSTKA